jgi:hypothetical protein
MRDYIEYQKVNIYVKLKLIKKNNLEITTWRR